jgi:hypothetical protein
LAHRRRVPDGLTVEEDTVYPRLTFKAEVQDAVFNQ